MDGSTILAGFIATWAQLGAVYYKLGRIEGKVKVLCGENCAESKKLLGPLLGK